MFLIEGLITITGGGNSKRIVVEGINILIFVSSVSVAYLFAIRGKTPAQALKFLLQPYVYLVLIIAVLGLTAWSLVHTGLVDPADWHMPDQFTFGRQSDTASSDYYWSPFYLSGIMSQSSGQLLGFSFHRASGLFEEPALAAFFIAPAIFLMPLVVSNRSSRWKLRLGIATVIAFLLVVNSTTNIFIMTTIGFLILARVILSHPRVKARMQAALTLLVIGPLAWLIIAQLVGTYSEFRLVGASQINAIQQSLDHGKIFGPGILEPIRPGNPRGVVHRGLLSWFVVLFHISVVSIVGIRMLFSRSSKWYLGGAILYIAGHSMKSFGHTATSGYYVYILVVLALTLACYWQIGRPETAPEKQGGGSR